MLLNKNIIINIYIYIYYKKIFEYNVVIDFLCKKNTEHHKHYAMVAVTGLRSVPAEVGEYVQGFLTNKNRFVDRKEAAQIALKCNQISEPKRILFSEDVY